MFTSREILDIALKIEKYGEAVYRQAILDLVNPDIARRLTWIADEEARHAEWFMKLQSQLSNHKDHIA